MKSLRAEVRAILTDRNDARYVVFLWCINLLIILSAGLLFYETLTPNIPWPVLETLRWIDYGILIIFAIEYAGRLWVIPDALPRSVKLSGAKQIVYVVRSRLRFMLSPWGLIDLLALLPLVPFLRSLRILRLLRLFHGVRMFRYNSPLRSLSDAARDNGLLFSVAFGFVFLCIAISATLFFFAEYGQNAGVTSMTDTLWWSIVTISTVGFGDITPQTFAGRVIGSVLMIAGMFVIAMFAGVVSSTLVGRLIPLQQEQIRMSTLSDHIIIAGWNDTVPILIQQLQAELKKKASTPLLVFAPILRPEELASEITFVQGDFTRESEYDKVRLKFASAVVVVSDTSQGEMRSAARDASAVLTVFTVRRLERSFTQERKVPLHICAEILDPENIDHATTAGADEVLATSLVSNGLLAHTAAYPGVSAVISDLLMPTHTNLYTSPLPIELLEGNTLPFGELQRKMREHYGALLIGIIRRGERRLNPDLEFPVLANDALIYLNKVPIDLKVDR